jgi:tetratricopeptide (TPR) repeat protein
VNGAACSGGWAAPPSVRLISILIEGRIRDGGAAEVRTLADLARVLRELRRRQARRSGGAAPTYRELAAATGWSHGIIGEYLSGRVLPPTGRFDVLIRLLGATPAEQGALATARDRVEEQRRGDRPERGGSLDSGTDRSGANGGTGGAGRPAVPRQLPVDVFGFTGRTEELARLDGLLGLEEESPPRPSPTVITAMAGTAGVGKTALAVRWAHRAAGRFPDGQLYADLRGYDPERPLSPAQALARFLRSLGVDGADIPADDDERAALYRSLLADRRVLVVLDNASDADQVRPLLPGSASCFVLVTSRDALAGLVAREGARRIALDRLSPAESATLLRTLIGARVDAEPESAAELAEQCTHLPLALRVAAELATARPEAPLAELVADLGDERRRLDALDAGGDPRTAVRAVFSWSLGRLPAPAAHAFALLGLNPGADADAYTLAALADRSAAEARALIDELARAHLIEPAAPGRFAMHDLLRAYAAERAAACCGGPDERKAALTRLFDHYLHAAGAAMDTLFPHERGSRPPVAPPRTPAPPLAEAETAGRWLDAQRPNLVAVALHAARHGWAGHCVALSGTLWRAFEVSGHYQDALAVHTAAANAALDELDDKKDAGPVPDKVYGRADVLANLGSAYWWTGEHRRARECFEQSLAEHPPGGDPQVRARALARLALVHERLGDYAAALSCLGGALEIYRHTGNRHGEGAQLVNLGALQRRLGRLTEAAGHQREAARIFAELGDRRLEGYALGNLATVDAALGRHADALAHLERALANCRAAGDRGGEGSAIGTIGLVHRLAGDFPRALDHLDQALGICRETGERSLETETLNTLGETLLAAGRPEASLDRHVAALDLARRTGDQFERARALDGAGCALAAAGDAARAREQWTESLRIYSRLGVPEAAQVRERLAGRAG